MSIKKLLNLDKRTRSGLRNTCVSEVCRAVECIELGIRLVAAIHTRHVTYASYAGALGTLVHFYVRTFTQCVDLRNLLASSRAR